MLTRSHHRSFRSSTSLVLLLALLVLGLGLPRLVLVCNESCCAGRVALTRSCGIQERAANTRTDDADVDACPCCRRQREATTRLGTLAADEGGCGGCSHHALGCEIAPPQAFELPDMPSSEPCLLATLALHWTRRDCPTAAHPPTTGPPRPDQRTSLLATTVLRI